MSRKRSMAGLVTHGRMMVAAALAFSSVAVAQDTGTGAQPPASSAETACFSGPARLPDAEIQAFLATPSSLLADFPSGGLPLSTRVRSLAGSEASTLDGVIGLVGVGSPPQVAAIGAGLARASRACATVNPEYAATIQERVATLGNQALELAFEQASAEVQTAALGTAVSVGGVGGGTVGGIGGGGAAGGGANGIAGTTAATGSSSGNFSVGSGGDGSFTETTVASPSE